MLRNRLTNRVRLQPDVTLPKFVLSSVANAQGMGDRFVDMLSDEMSHAQMACQSCGVTLTAGPEHHAYYDFELTAPDSSSPLPQDILKVAASKFFRRGPVPQWAWLSARWTGVSFLCDGCRNIAGIGLQLKGASRLDAENSYAQSVVRPAIKEMMRLGCYPNPHAALMAIAEAWKGARQLLKLLGNMAPDGRFAEPKRTQYFHLDLQFGYDHPSLQLPERFMRMRAVPADEPSFLNDMSAMDYGPSSDPEDPQ